MKKKTTLIILQKKRIALEKDLAYLRKKEEKLKIYLNKQEKALIKKLQKFIKDKKAKIDKLETQKSILQKKLTDLNRNYESEKTTSRPTNQKTHKSNDEVSEESNIYFSVPGNKEPHLKI
jgi:hypothetical protein